jgi:hypothetical protein
MGCTARQCPGAIIIPAIHYRPANLNGIHNSNICRRYRSISHGHTASQKLQTNLDAVQMLLKKWRKTEGIQLGPCHIHHTNRNLPLSPYKQGTPSSTTKFQVPRVAPRQENYLPHTYIHITEVNGNDAHQNVLAPWTEVKTLHKQQNSHTQSSTQTSQDLWNINVEYGVHFKHSRHPRTIPIYSFAYDYGCTLKCRIWLFERISKHEQLKKKSAITALNTVLASATPKRPSSEPHGTTRQQEIAKTPLSAKVGTKFR